MTEPDEQGASRAVKDQIAAFLGNQRWFAGKGLTFEVVEVRRLATLPGPPDVTVELVTVQTENGQQTTYQLPLAHYDEEQDRIGHAHVGTWETEDGAVTHAYDAAHCRDAMGLYLHAFADGRHVPGLTFHRIAGHELDLDVHSTLFSGEQSNSSVAFGDDSLLKLFRKVSAGVNPDIEIHEALTEAGSTHVAALYGWLEGSPVDSGRSGQRLQLAMLQQFLKTASDGWELALNSVRNLFAEGDLHADEVGGDFEGESHRLGVAVAEVHRVLRQHFPTQRLDVAAVAAAMNGRLDRALDDVPELKAHEPILREAFDALGGVRADQVAQRVHGDLHLGQTLRTSLGWKLVDFEGEPAKPLEERLQPDSAWRDVAGMLRSFDYAARSMNQDFEHTEEEAAQLAYRGDEWVTRNSNAFLEGYAEELGPRSDEDEVLVRAYLADKAVYEVLYEARNRPGWIGIPLAAIDRLTQEAR
jgi:maltokinase